MVRGKPGHERHNRNDADGTEHLYRAALEHVTPHAHDARQRQFQSDREEQEHRPDLGQLRHAADVAHEAQCMRADHDPREEETDQRGDSQPVREHDRGNGDRNEHDQVPEDRDGFHSLAKLRRRQHAHRARTASRTETQKCPAAALQACPSSRRRGSEMPYQ